MKIVIDIPDSLYENILICWENIHPKVWKILKNGKPLPKGHGDLIDRKVLLNNGYQMEPVEMWYGIKYAPTIIEADTESENKE